jgi:hypothetical protein
VNAPSIKTTKDYKVASKSAVVEFKTRTGFLSLAHPHTSDNWGEARARQGNEEKWSSFMQSLRPPHLSRPTHHPPARRKKSLSQRFADSVLFAPLLPSPSSWPAGRLGHD